MTTWASTDYVTRLMEVAALADVIVYVASDERYNDEVPTQFLHLLVKAGKAVVVVLTKVREADAAGARRALPPRDPRPAAEAARRRRRPPCPSIAFPQMPPAERTDPAGAGAKYRVAAAQPDSRAVRVGRRATAPRTVTNAAKYLSTAGEGLLDVARRDLAEFDAWKATVRAGQGRVRGPLPQRVPVRRAVPPLRPLPRRAHRPARTARAPAASSAGSSGCSGCRTAGPATTSPG